MINFLRKYPSTGTAANALYWLGRNAERNGNPGHARAFYEKATDRFPATYFAHAADQRLSTKWLPGDTDPADALAEVPAPPPLRPFDEPIPPPRNAGTAPRLCAPSPSTLPPNWN